MSCAAGRCRRVRRAWLPLALLAALSLPTGVAARFPVQEASTGLAAGSRREPHPAAMSQVLEVARDLPSGPTSLALRYWRTAPEKANRGRVTVRIEILRAADGGGPARVIERLRAGGRVSSGFFERTVRPREALRAGDLILVTFRLRRMPRIPRHQSASTEVLLRLDR